MIMSAVDACLLRGSVAKWTYWSGLHGRLRVTTHELRMDAGSGLPAALVLAFASDLHAGPTTHPEIFRSLVEQIDAIRPDVLLLGGDYVYCRAEYIEVLCESLSG